MPRRVRGLGAPPVRPEPACPGPVRHPPHLQRRHRSRQPAHREDPPLRHPPLPTNTHPRLNGRAGLSHRRRCWRAPSITRSLAGWIARSSFRCVMKPPTAEALRNWFSGPARNHVFQPLGHIVGHRDEAVVRLGSFHHRRKIAGRPCESGLRNRRADRFAGRSPGGTHKFRLADQIPSSGSSPACEDLRLSSTALIWVPTLT